MKSKYTKLFLSLMVTFSAIISFELTQIAAEEDFLVVDDIETTNSNENYFTYTAASDPAGATGWAADTKSTISGDQVAKTQHWVWNSNYAEAAKHTYTFTFVGTGVEIIGVKSDATNNFQLDSGNVETVAITGVANTPTTLYSKKNLTYGEHTVAVTLPSGGTGLQVSYAKVFGSKLGEVEKTEIPHKKTTGTNNKFTFSENGWSSAGNEEHVWSDVPSTTLQASDIWYEVSFVGNKIDVYAGKNRPMGKVEYFIDGVSKGKYSLYNGSNINSALIATFADLSEGTHTLKAVATGEKDASATNTGIDCSKVVVYHAPYIVNDLQLTTSSYTLSEGAQQQITYTLDPDYATLSDLKYLSSDEEIATVNSTGLISAIGEGNAQITLSSAKFNISKSISVSVTAATPQIGGSIVDTDTQYTQTRYDDVKNKGLVSTQISAWKNDKANSEIAIISKESKLKNVTVSASDLTDGSNTISKNNVKTTFIKSTKAYNGGYLGYGSKDRVIPADNGSNRSESSDILYQSTPIDVPFNKVQPIWVEFNIPENAKAGTYTSTITVNADGISTPLTFTYTIKVQGAILNDASTFKDSFDIELWQYPYSSAEYYDVEPFSQEHLDIMKSGMEIYKSMGGHAITTTISEEAWSGQTYSANEVHYPSMVKWTKKADGSFTYDYSDFDKWVQFNKDLGIGDKIVLYSIAPWHNSFTYWENGTLKYESYTVGSARYKTVWTDFLRNMIDHLEKKGWFDESYIGIDERGFSSQAFDLVDSVRNIHDKPLKTAGAMDGFVNKHDLALRVTDLNVGDNAAAAHASEFTQLVKDREAKGYRTTLYSCTEHQPGNFSLSAPVESYWSMVNAGKETTGFLRWAYDAWVEDPLNDATHNSFEPGDTFLIYPDQKDAKNPTSKSSVRLEKMAEGVRDVNKIKMMVAEIPSLQSDVNAMYAKITTTAGTARSYLSADKVAKLSLEMSTFKADLEKLTSRYLALKESGTNIVESVTISEKDTSLTLGSSLQLHANVNPDNVLNSTIEWTSSNDSVVTVSNTGVISANKLGTATISAISKQDSSKKASIEVRVTGVEIPEKARIAYYSFDDETADDQWGSRNGIVNGASFVDGKSKKAIKVNETENVTFDATSGIGENDAWTISYWVKPETEFDKRISVMMSSDKKYSFDLKMAADRDSGYHVGTGSGDVLTYKYGFTKDVWYNVAWTQSKTNGLTMYVNGKKVNENSWTKTNKALAPLDIIGGTGFNGLIDELQVFNKVLSLSEINAAMSVKGLNLSETNKSLFINETYNIETNLVSDNEDKAIIYTSNDPSVASVDVQGKVTALKKGTTVISVENKAGGFKENVTITVAKKLTISSTIPQYQLSDKNLSDIEKAPGTNRQYLGQPDMVRTSTGRLITAFPTGHGKGPIIMKISDNDGSTWKEKTDIPSSWTGSQETPTMYVLNLGNGKERIMLITACPGWGTDSNGNQTGWNTSYSDDNGQTWSEYAHWYTNHTNGNANKSIVAMASLVQLKDENGNFIQKWMGVYHDYGYVNYKTYLTYDENGKEQWSEPTPYLSEYRNIESSYQMCEIGMFRSPDGNRIVGLARSQSHNNPATLIYSDDEGETWSKPMDLPGSLAGERHKAAYDPISGRLVITFREIKYDLNGNNKFDGGSDWTCGEWIAWVGTYEDLMEQNDGQYTFVIEEDWANNEKSGDTGYAGVVVLDDGTFIMDSYGHWDKDFSMSWGGGVTTDLCYIKQAKFKLGEIENQNNLVDRSKLNKFIDQVKYVDGTLYTDSTYAVFKKALKDAETVNTDSISQQIEVDKVLGNLSKAFKNLTKDNKVDVIQGEDAPNVKVDSNLDEIKNAVLTKDEIKDNVSLNLELQISAVTNLSDEVKNAINTSLNGNEKIGCYLNLDLFKIVDGKKSKLNNLNGKIRITIDIPEELLGKEKYSILRYHEGKVEVLKDLDDDPNTITFETDQFSVFAISYLDKTTPTEPINPTLPNNGSSSVQGNGSNTGDTTNTGALLMTMLVTGAIVVMMKRKKKNKA